MAIMLLFIHDGGECDQVWHLLLAPLLGWYCKARSSFVIHEIIVSALWMIFISSGFPPYCLFVFFGHVSLLKDTCSLFKCYVLKHLKQFIGLMTKYIVDHTPDQTVMLTAKTDKVVVDLDRARPVYTDYADDVFLHCLCNTSLPYDLSRQIFFDSFPFIEPLLIFAFFYLPPYTLCHYLPECPSFEMPTSRSYDHQSS